MKKNLLKLRNKFSKNYSTINPNLLNPATQKPPSCLNFLTHPVNLLSQPSQAIKLQRILTDQEEYQIPFLKEVL